MTIKDYRGDFDSVTNQRIKREFVAREVFTNVTFMVEYILEKSWEDAEAPFGWEDVTNLYKDNSEEIEEMEEEIEGLENQLKESEKEEIKERIEKEISDIEKLKEEYEDEQREELEILEWWLVSGFLARKLSEKGEPVILQENLWGRTCSGQAILLDSVISEICYDLEILEGQQYEWTI